MRFVNKVMRRPSLAPFVFGLLLPVGAGACLVDPGEAVGESELELGAGEPVDRFTVALDPEEARRHRAAMKSCLAAHGIELPAEGPIMIRAHFEGEGAGHKMKFVSRVDEPGLPAPAHVIELDGEAGEALAACHAAVGMPPGVAKR